MHMQTAAQTQNHAVARKPRTERVLWTVSPTSQGDLRSDPKALPWTVKRNGEVMARFHTQREAVTFAVTVCRSALAASGQRSSLRIHRGRNGPGGKRRGTVRDERTYGDDPRRTRG